MQTKHGRQPSHSSGLSNAFKHNARFNQVIEHWLPCKPVLANAGYQPVGSYRGLSSSLLRMINKLL